VLDAQQGFKCGVSRLIAKLFELGVVKEKNGTLPTVRSYNEACAKLPVEIIQQQLTKSHLDEFAVNGKTFHGLKIMIPDGTKISMSNTDETRDKYGEGQGHYTQAQALGFYDLSTGTFEDFKVEHTNTSERTIALRHMSSNETPTLYVADAGYSGMAFTAICVEHKHNLLTQLKHSALAKNFRKTKKRSALVAIRLTKTHLANHPGHQHLLGKCITVRLLRTRGTSRLESQVLITTLLDEKEFTWQELTKLYLQRYTVELAFRHLKTTIGIERIRKQKLQRIEQLMFAAVVLYNLSAMLRNRIRRPSIMPEKEGVKVYCFTLCIELVHVLLQAAMRPVHGVKKKMDTCLRAIRGCWFIYKPWRSEPRICHTPPSDFSVQKGAAMAVEFTKAEFLTVEYDILAQEYGQKELKNA
jgi:hypothetical protein